MTYVFGPVPSRRLGISLGIDLTPRKTCTFDCLYCQVGKTTCSVAEPRVFVPTAEVIRELDEKLDQVVPDVVTISGSGEPTLHSEIDHIIAHLRRAKDFRIALLTNGSLFWKVEVRRRVLGAHMIMPTLSAGFEETFRLIHRPHPGITLNRVVTGLKKLRQEYSGQLLIEVMLLQGVNDRQNEMEALNILLEEINPDRIQLNTVVRPPADPRALSLDSKRLEEIKKLFGPRAEIIAGTHRRGKGQVRDSLFAQTLEMAKRRPVRVVDVADALGLPLPQAEKLMKGLELRGDLRIKEHGDDLYYIASLDKEQS